METHGRTKTSGFYFFATLFLVVASLYFAREVLILFAISALVAAGLSPVVRLLERLRLHRIPATIITVLFIFGIFSGIGYVVYHQLAQVSQHLPQYRKTITAKIESISHAGGLIHDVRKMDAVMHHTASTATTQAAVATTQITGGTASGTAAAQNAQVPPQRVVVTNVQNSGSGSNPWAVVQTIFGKVVGPVGEFIMIVVFTIFMLIMQEDLRDRVVRLVGRSRFTVTTQALGDASSRISRYLLMQALVNASVGTCIFLLLWLIGVLNGKPFPEPALWGLLTALLRFVPYVGIWFSSLMPIGIALAVFGSFTVPLEVFAAYCLVEGLTANLFEPKLLGSSTGIATLAVLMAATFWAWLWGPLGLLISVPLTVCLVVLGKYVPQLAFLSIMLGDEPALSPPSRLYERLLALNTDGAHDLVHEFSKDKPLVQVYDDMVLPALAMLEEDQQRGNLEPDRQSLILTSLRDIVDEMGERQKSKRKKQRDDAINGKKQTSEVAGEDANPSLPEGLTAVVQPNNDFKLPTSCTVSVACLAAHDQADEIAAIMLQQLLEIRSYCVILGADGSLVSELAAAIETAQPDVLCVSSVPPSATLHARQLLKRLDKSDGEIPIVAGLWHAKIDPERARHRLGVESSLHVACTLAEALEQIHQLAQPSITRAFEKTV